MIHCPSCGGGLRFDIASQQMACDYCGSQFDPASTADMNKEAKETKTFESYVFLCPSCGGELLTTDKNDAVGFCPFCGGASMLFDRIHQQWEPEYIIPFQITKEQCKELYAKEASKSIFTAKQYRDPQLIESFRGIYMPYWNYQAIQKGSFHMQGEYNGFFTKKTYSISGETDLKLDGYGHDASMAFDDRLSENIAPFDPSMHRPFAPGYLSGFYADIGDVDAHAYDAKGEDCIRENTAQLMAKDPQIEHPKGSSNKVSAIPQTAKIPTKIVSAQRTLYPVWFMSYRNKDKITYAAVNGQTGKVSADLPVSPLRVMIAVLLLGAILAAGMFFLPSVKANLTLLMTTALLIVGTIILRFNYKNVVNPESGLDATEEAKQFQKKEKIRYVIIGISVFAALVVAYLDLAYNAITYLVCILLAGELFWMMYRHIRFQVEIAKRSPPQFNKKGAAYDEN